MKKVFIKKNVMFCVMMLTMAAYCVNITACKKANVNHSASAKETNDMDFAKKDFTLNGINYSINYDNKTVTVGKNKHVNGILSIPASVTYNGKTYSVTKIGKSAFYDCSSLTQVNIPNSVTEIGIGGAIFANCSGLTSISVANDNPNYDSRNNCNAIIETKTNTLIAGCKSTVIPNSVTKIGDGTFFGCSSLTQVNIPNSVIKIGEFAFYGCSSLTQVTIPNSVTKIGDGTFFGCSSLTQVTVPKWLARDKKEMERVFPDFNGTVKVNSDSNE